MAYSNLAQNDKAEQSLRRALKHGARPTRPPTSILACCWASKAGCDEAEQALRAALKADPQLAAAAFNLGVILGEKNLDEALAWCRKAHALRPADPKYAHTLAFFQRKKGNVDEAMQLLRKVIQDEPSYLDAYLLLGEIHEQRRDFAAAARVYFDASQISRLPPRMRSQLDAKARAMRSAAWESSPFRRPPPRTKSRHSLRACYSLALLFRPASMSRFSSSGVSFGRSIESVNLSSLPVNVNGHW